MPFLESGERIDLMVTDVGLPNGINGRQLADAARAKRPGLKILFITGYAENAVLNQNNLEPGMYVMTKPFAGAGGALRSIQPLSRLGRGSAIARCFRVAKESGSACWAGLCGSSAGPAVAGAAD